MKLKIDLVYPSLSVPLRDVIIASVTYSVSKILVALLETPPTDNGGLFLMCVILFRHLHLTTNISLFLWKLAKNGNFQDCRQI